MKKNLHHPGNVEEENEMKESQGSFSILSLKRLFFHKCYVDWNLMKHEMKVCGVCWLTCFPDNFQPLVWGLSDDCVWTTKFTWKMRSNPDFFSMSSGGGGETRMRKCWENYFCVDGLVFCNRRWDEQSKNALGDINLFARLKKSLEHTSNEQLKALSKLMQTAFWRTQVVLMITFAMTFKWKFKCKKRKQVVYG